MPIPIVNLRKVKRKNSHIYMVDYTINTKRIRKTIGTNKREAELIKADIQNKITLGHFELVANDKKRTSLNQLINSYILENKNYLAPKTIARYNSHVLPFQQFINKYFKTELKWEAVAQLIWY